MRLGWMNIGSVRGKSEKEVLTLSKWLTPIALTEPTTLTLSPCVNSGARTEKTTLKNDDICQKRLAVEEGEKGGLRGD